MRKWLRKGRQLWERHIPARVHLPARVHDWLKALRVRHINLFFAIVFSLAGAVIIAYGAAGVLAPLLKVNDDPTPPADLTRIALTVAAGVGGVVALVVAYRRQRDLEQGRFVEGFGAAAKQFGDPDPAVRMAGVYAMAGVADQTSKMKRQQCIDVLCGYLRLPYSPELGNNHQSGLTLKKPAGPQGGPEEELRFQYRQNDKEVRQTIVRVIAAHLRKKAAPSWSSLDFNFDESHLEDPDFGEAVFNGETRFYGVIFSGDTTSFMKASFSGDTTTFKKATFSSKNTWFSGASFSSEDTSFSGVTFSGDITSFGGATFKGDLTWFGGATFSSGLTKFSGATFSGGLTRFRGATFSSKKTDFESAFFVGKDTSFHEANFGVGRVTFISPSMWNPAPKFDWDPRAAATPNPPKPANVEPADWPPVAMESVKGPPATRRTVP